mgnify:CR=1 FL=1
MADGTGVPAASISAGLAWGKNPDGSRRLWL